MNSVGMCEREGNDEPIGADEGEEGLCRLLDGLIEGFRGRVAILAEDLVLGKEHALCEK
jgi:hypothetical protein